MNQRQLQVINYLRAAAALGGMVNYYYHAIAWGFFRPASHFPSVPLY
jgi:hypothetical protein